MPPDTRHHPTSSPELPAHSNTNELSSGPPISEPDVHIPVYYTASDHETTPTGPLSGHDQEELPHSAPVGTSASTTPTRSTATFSVPYHTTLPSYLPPSSGLFIPNLRQHTPSPPSQIHAPVPQVPFKLDAISISPIEDPDDPTYKKYVEEEAKLQEDEGALLAEIRGEHVVPVHGCGMWAYTGHTTPAAEQMKQVVWKQHGSRETWLASARARTAYYAQPGAIRPPLRWVLVERDRHQDIPDDALQTGTEADGRMLYSARGWHDGGVHLGKATRHIHNGGASIPYRSMEHFLFTFEVLVGDSFYARWVELPHVSAHTLSSSASAPALLRDPTPMDLLLPSLATSSSPLVGGSFKPLQADSATTPDLPVCIPLEGGREANGAPLFVAQAQFDMGWHPGKAGLNEDHCCIGYDGGEVWVRTFRMLAYALD